MNVRRAVGLVCLAQAFVACSILTRFDGLVPGATEAAPDGSSTGEAGLAQDGGDARAKDGSGSMGGDSGGVPGAAFGAACGQYFTGLLARCYYPGYPPAELARLQARWVTFCESSFALPGTTASPGGLALCAAALQTEDCFYALYDGILPSACDFFGSGGGGTACLANVQCQSGSCDYYGPDGAVDPGCGTCDSPVQSGQPCGTPGTACLPPEACLASSHKCGVFDAGPAPAFVPQGGGCNGGYCAPGLVCGPALTCVPPSYASPGQSCDELSNVCLQGYCVGASLSASSDGGLVSTPGTCAAIVADGQPCDLASATSTCDAFAVCVNGTCVLELGASLCQ